MKQMVKIHGHVEVVASLVVLLFQDQTNSFPRFAKANGVNQPGTEEQTKATKRENQACSWVRRRNVPSLYQAKHIPPPRE
jgi:hypothetical protein